MQKANLNLIPGSVYPVINVSQYDEGRQFKLALFDGASSYDLTGKTVTILVGKTDGHGCAYDATDEVHSVPVIATSGNLVTVTTPVQMTAAAGDNMAELQITDSNAEIRTLNFILRCEPAALDPGTPLSGTEIPAIERAGWDAVDHYPRINPGNNHWEVWDVTAGDWVDTGVSAGGGGVTDYDDLTNRPQINGFMLTGNKTAADLGLATDSAMTGASSGSAGAKGLAPAPAAGDQNKVLRGDGTWQNETDTLAGLTDTNISSPTDGQVLKYDNATSKWVNGNGGGGGSSTLAGLSDVNLSTPTAGQPLTYDDDSGKWVNGGIIPTANGGTGNSDGYIRTGIKSGTTVGTRATAEGINNTSSGQDAHAEGIGTTSEGQGSHSEGWGTTAHGPESHAEGISTEARGSGAHSEGSHTSATGTYTHAGGYYTLAQYDSQTAIGKYNKNESDSLFEVGNGTGTGSDRSNAIAVKNDGRIQKGASNAFAAASNLAPVEMTKTMAASHAAGSFLYVAEDDQFYQVGSSALSVGATLTPGTNATAKSVADVLSALTSELTNKLDGFENIIKASGETDEDAIKRWWSSLPTPASGSNKIKTAILYGGNDYVCIAQLIGGNANAGSVFCFSYMGDCFILCNLNGWTKATIH
jgi:hypothetical protein